MKLRLFALPVLLSLFALWTAVAPSALLCCAVAAEEKAPDQTQQTADNDDSKTDKNAAKGEAAKDVQKALQERLDKAKDQEEYYELLKLFVDTLDQIDRNYVKDVSRRELMEAAIQGMISKLDQYSDYIPPEELDQFKGDVENQFGGIGIQIGIVNRQLTIISPLVGTPAYRAGLVAGDIITRIEEKSTKGLSISDAVKLLKGKAGTSVNITVQHKKDGGIEKVALKREIVQVQTVLGDQRKEDDSWDFLFDDEKKIGYIRISAFSRHTVGELQAALGELTKQDAKALVLDLRFNPGGLLSSAIRISDMFISQGRIVSTEGRNAPERVWDAKEEGTFKDIPMVVLVNRYSASASEIVSACLQDHKRAVILGERTWGKGSVQNIIQLEGGRSALKMTTAGYHRPSGKNIHRSPDATEKDVWGVSPNKDFELKLSDVELSQLHFYRRNRDILDKSTDEQEEATETESFVDKQLEKALTYLRQQLNPEKPANETAKADEKKVPAEKAPAQDGDAKKQDAEKKKEVADDDSKKETPQ